MLVWTDAPGHGLGGSTPAWNNNLDLEVVVGGDVYRGNNFDASGWSQPGGPAEGKNNTEGVFLGTIPARLEHIPRRRMAQCAQDRIVKDFGLLDVVRTHHDMAVHIQSPV